MGFKPRIFLFTVGCLKLGHTTSDVAENKAVIFGQYKILKLLLENSSYREGWKNKLQKMWTCRVPLNDKNVFCMDLAFCLAIGIPFYQKSRKENTAQTVDIGKVWTSQGSSLNAARVDMRVLLQQYNWLQCTLLKYKFAIKSCSSMNLFDLVNDWELSFNLFEKL
jgi:hypothetical protein